MLSPLQTQHLALDRLEGHWLIERLTTSAKGPGGRFLGEARFDRLGPAHLRFIEHGVQAVDGGDHMAKWQSAEGPNEEPSGSDFGPLALCDLALSNPPSPRPLPASRAGEVRLDPASLALVVLRSHPALGMIELHRLSFAPMTNLSPTTLVARHTHHCGDDLYHATFRINDSSVEIEYIVEGPHKSYISCARLRRA